ncbi:hypothetical protein [Otoolea muris]|uniref:hypothetical protein n=1 Tax=Otoolea muris TaxID=2941515 RepID=UPI00203B9CEB|nr:hypothetical protein [Otoolea muris]
MYVFVFFALYTQKPGGGIRQLFTPGTIILLFLIPLLVYIDYGKMADSWDEFTHWMDCVKAMTYLDTFVTNAESHSQFRSYPPIMALMQYLFQKLHLLIYPARPFSEWRNYFSYQIFALAMFLPLFSEVTLKQWREMIVITIIVWLTPLFFCSEFYSITYIDPFVGILSGCGFANILFRRNKGFLYHAYIVLDCISLVLAKDAGLLFAVFISIAYIFDEIIIKYDIFLGDNQGICENRRKRVPVSQFYYIFVPLFCTLISKQLWNYKLKKDGTGRVFAAKMDLANYTKLFFSGGDNTYRQESVDNFKNAFFENRIPLGNTETSYFVLFCIALIICIWIYFYLKKQSPDKGNVRNVKARKYAIIVLMIQVLTYIYGMGIAYITNFPEGQAVGLASYERYISMPYNTLWIVIIWGMLYIIHNEDGKIFLYSSISIVAIVLLITPMNYTGDLLARKRVKRSIEWRANWQPFSDLIRKTCDGSDTIYFVAQETNGMQWWITKFNARPANVFVEDRTWSFGPPFYEGDIWSKDISVSDFKRILLENYDYLALYHLNEYFIETYADLFENKGDIQEGCLYRIDKATGIMELCH